MAEKKFLDFLDRFDGGGMGKSGGEFEGGGLLSMLGNLLFDPYGSDDEDRMASRNQFYNAQGNAVAPPSLLAPKSAPAQGMSLDSAPAMPRMPNGPKLTFPDNPSGPISDGLGPIPQRLQGDPNLGFNPANAAPVQVEGSGMTPANNYVPSSTPFDPSAAVDFTMPDSSPINPPAPQPSQEQIAQKFGEDMFNAYGREKANSIMSSPNGQGVYLHYINNGYQLPAL